jgi:DNA-binding PadR family transcriptional regulator
MEADMYELLILGALMSRNMSGYKLRKVLESSLVPRREISNGSMYPLLAKLEDKGYIEFLADNTDSRNKKVAQITAAGKDRFLDLMAQPIADDAKRESLYRFKFRGMPGVDVAQQTLILDDYERQTQQDRNIYEGVRSHLQHTLKEPAANKPYLNWSMRNLALSIALCDTKLTWIKDCRKVLAQKDGD